MGCMCNAMLLGAANARGWTEEGRIGDVVCGVRHVIYVTMVDINVALNISHSFLCPRDLLV